jgi:hypothetical protein
MIRFPTSSRYQEALQHPEHAFASPRLAGAEVAETVLGLPRAYSGAVAVVFPLEIRGERYALKCFVRSMDALEARYRSITSYVDKENLRSFHPGKWIPDGIRIENRTYPVLLTPWWPGTPLNRFVESHLDQPDVLAALAESWRDLADEIEASGLAHGDLQHGNILVDLAEGTRPVIRLIDFDGAYVPALRRRSALDIGHRHFQHPDRTRDDFGPDIDRFSTLVIYTAIRVAAVRPDLWDRFDTDENLLFTADDYFDPASSKLFAELRESDQIAGLSRALAAACLLPFERIPPLSEAIDNGVSAGAFTGRRRHENTEAARASVFERFFLTAMLSWLLASLFVAVGGWHTSAALMLVVGVAGFVSAARFQYLRRPDVRRRRRIRREVAYSRKVVAELEDERRSLGTSRKSYAAGRQELRERRLTEIRTAALRKSLKHHFVHEAIAEAGVPHTTILRLKRAGIRTAFHADDGALDRVTQTSSENLRRVRGWRLGLVRRYESQLPDDLSPAEERRLKRQIEHRMQAFQAEDARLTERIAIQQRIIDELEGRIAGAGESSFPKCLAALILRRPHDERVTIREH